MAPPSPYLPSSSSTRPLDDMTKSPLWGLGGTLGWMGHISLQAFGYAVPAPCSFETPLHLLSEHCGL